MSTELYIMGQWRNGDIARKTIAGGIVVTNREDSLEGIHVRKRRFNHAPCCGLFNFTRLLRTIHPSTIATVCRSRERTWSRWIQHGVRAVELPHASVSPVISISQASWQSSADRTRRVQPAEHLQQLFVNLWRYRLRSSKLGPRRLNTRRS